MNELKVTGKQDFMEIEIPVVLGDFGVGKKCLSDGTIADIHYQPTPEIRRRISDNILRFNENVDYLDLKKSWLRAITIYWFYDCTEITKELGIYSTSGKPHNQANKGGEINSKI